MQIPRRKRHKRRHPKRFLFLLMMALAIVGIAFLYETRIRPVMNQLASQQAQSVAVSTINDEVNRIISSESIQYGDLVSLQMDTNGRVSAATANIVEINRLKSEFALCVQEKMRSIDKMTLRIPLGSLLSDGLFTGYGPRLPIKLTTIGRAVVDIEDSFLDAGINQTRHAIYLTITAKVGVLMPGGTSASEVHTSIPIAQSVIVGEVPDSVTSVTGVSGEPQDNVLNLLD